MPMICLLVSFCTCTSINKNNKPIVIGHRGFCGVRPENTLASYDKAIDIGADYIEIDVATTKDHVLVASHNPDITHTTDVGDHPEFRSRYTKKNISGVEYEGYFVDDFTVSELKTLRTRERYSFRGNSWDNMFPMPTVQEYLSFIKAKEIEMNKKIGIYLETKHPHYYRSVGLPIDELLVQMLHDNGYTKEDDMVFIESFESNLKEIRKITKLPLIQLISGSEGDSVQYDSKRRWSELATDEGLREIATYAQGVAPHKSVIIEISKNSTEKKMVLSNFVELAHKHNLVVHVWTFRVERDNFEKKEKILFDDVEVEMNAFFKIGIDGIFTDQPDVGIRVRDLFISEEPQTQIYILGYQITYTQLASTFILVIALVIFFFANSNEEKNKIMKKISQGFSNPSSPNPGSTPKVIKKLNISNDN